MRRITILSLLFLFTHGCNCGGDPDAPPGGADSGMADAGPGADAGSVDAGPADAGPMTDAGPMADAGPNDAGQQDGGDQVDAGSTDAGADLDGGVDRDGGVDVDGGSPIEDAGSGDDAGLVVDSGQAADGGSPDDAGVVTDDAGAADSGVNSVDSGQPTDAGQPNVDSGNDADSGVDEVKDGGPASDAGLPGNDGGGNNDAGGELDAGPSPEDGGGMAFIAPTQDGTISPDEYGDHTLGVNRYDNQGGNQAWYITWDAEALYLAIDLANVDEAMVFYFEAGVDQKGVVNGQPYDNTTAAPLPLVADLVIYAKSDYHEYRFAESPGDGGIGGWGAPTANTLTVVDNGSNIRELKIPWSIGGELPQSFNFLGYLTSAGGLGYGEIPNGNPTGLFGTAAFTQYFAVPDSSVDAPFANPVNTAVDGG